MSTNQYIVSARKYRPATFQTVVGQRALTATLKNAILGGKLAQAYLFCGPRGVGKTSCARIFAKTINCMNPTPDGEACGECESCKAIDKGNSFNLVELDAASNNSVDDIRSITEQVNIPAQDGRYRVFIIDEVHMLSNNAFNAFLKTLEEPPKNVVFILATTERHKVIPTILSRCQVYDFRRITINDIIDHLQYVASSEGVTAEREALGVIALKADGAMRDALSIFDQVVASTGGNVTYAGTLDALNVLDQEYYFHLLEIFRNGDVSQALLTFKEITDKGFDGQFFVNGLAEHIRNLMVCADPRTVKLLETSEEIARKYIEQSPLFPIDWYYTAIKILNDTDFNYRLSGNKRLLVELALIRLSRLLNGINNPGTQPPANTYIPPQSTTRIQGSPGGTGPSSSPTQQMSSSGPQQMKAGGIANTGDTGTKDKQPTQPQRSPFVSPDGPKPQPAPVASAEALDSSGKRRVSSTRKSFRLTQDSPAVASESEPPQNSPFSIDQLKTAWEEYAASHPEQRILVAAMRGNTPTQISDFAYKIEVDHPAQKQAFETALPELLEFIKQKLKNASFTLEVTVSEKSDSQRGMSSKEFLKMAVEENPVLAKFLKEVDAELD